MNKDTDTPVNKAQPVDCVEVIRETSRIGENGTNKKHWLTFWRTPSKRDRQIAALQTGYAEMINLMRSIRLHLDQQTSNQDTLITHLPDAVQGLKAISQNAEQQTELLSLMHGQFESTLEREKMFTSSIDRFNNTLCVMDETNKNSATFIAELSERTDVAEDLVRTMLTRSQHRLIMMVAILLLTTLAVTGTAVYLLL